MIKTLLKVLFCVTVLLLTIANLEYKPVVMGAKTEMPTNPEQTYFEDLIKTSPNYFPAYIALYKITKEEKFLVKARSLNPNSVELPRPWGP